MTIRALRRTVPFILGIALLVPLVTIQPQAAPARAAGPWSFCSTAGQSFCIERVSVTDASNSRTDYTSASQMSTDGVLVDVSCLSPNGSCLDTVTTEQVISANSNGCAALPTTTPFPVYIDAAVTGHRDHRVDVLLNLGNSEPGLSVGVGIEGTSLTKDSSGIWHYEVRTKAVVRTMAQLPTDVQQKTGAAYDEAVRNFMSTATADMGMAKSTVSVFPPSVLRWIGEKGSVAWLTERSCDFVPLNGAWMTANANGFSFGVKTSPTGGGVPWYFKFAASAPHFIKSDMLNIQPGAFFGMYDHGPFSGSTMVNPASVKMWVPRAFGDKLGHASAAEFQSSLTVSTEDSQQASPTVVDSNDGYLVDLGVTHYSSPNPTLNFAPGKKYVPVVRSTSSSLKKGKSRSAASLATFAGLTVKKGSTVKIVVTGSSAKYCRVKGAAVVATRAGKCKVTVTVKPKTGRPSSRSVTITITG